MHFDSYNIRPFVQSGLTHRFSYENELTIDGEDFAFDDDDTSVFARAGFDFDLGKSTQAYLAVRGDASEDFQAIAAQVGVTFRLD
jgi:outer membrane autotransporter protein